MNCARWHEAAVDRAPFPSKRMCLDLNQRPLRSRRLPQRDRRTTHDSAARTRCQRTRNRQQGHTSSSIIFGSPTGVRVKMTRGHPLPAAPRGHHRTWQTTLSATLDGPLRYRALGDVALVYTAWYGAFHHFRAESIVRPCRRRSPPALADRQRNYSLRRAMAGSGPGRFLVDARPVRRGAGFKYKRAESIIRFVPVFPISWAHRQFAGGTCADAACRNL